MKTISGKEKKKTIEALKQEDKKPPKSSRIEEEEEDEQIKGNDHTKHMNVVLQKNDGREDPENNENNAEKNEVEDENANKILVEVK